MSVAVRTKRLIGSEFSTIDQSSVTSLAKSHDTEAPELECLEREAPESRVACWTEAPDAGEGRAHLHDHEFTHGRSQS
jgi:hypothetical protein